MNMTKTDKYRTFCMWYCGSDKKDEDDYDSNCKPLIKVNYGTAMNYLLDTDCQQILKDTIKAREVIDMIEIYQEMRKNAKKGDVKSAQYCQQFLESEFFDSGKSDIDLILDGLDIDE